MRALFGLCSWMVVFTAVAAWSATDSTSWLGVPSSQVAQGFDVLLAASSGYTTGGEQENTGLTPEPDVVSEDYRLELTYHFLPGLAGQMGVGMGYSTAENASTDNLDLYERWSGRLGVNSTLPLGSTNLHLAMQGGASLGMFRFSDDYLEVMNMDGAGYEWADNWQASPGWYAGGRIEFRAPKDFRLVLGLGGEYSYERPLYKREANYFMREETIVMDVSKVQFQFVVGYNFR